jgi:X-Pro dipeptidyl-peptidase
MAYFHQGGHGGPPPMALRNKWFTRFLYGIENGIENGPKAWIVREDPKESKPVAYADYPNPDASPVALFLSAGGRTRGGLGLKAIAGQKPEMIVDDAEEKGASLAEAKESEHRLLFVTPELEEPMHISGTARLTIRLACNKPATNLSVWMVSLPWTQTRSLTENIITRGWADPQNRKSLRKSEPLVPGEFVEMSFELQPDDQIIPVGQQIGLMIFASDHDFTLRPPAGTELTVDISATRLELPVVGGKAAVAKAIGSR